MTGPTYTVGRLARLAGLSRTTLLYYDRIGLLRPAGRSGSRYRLYGDDARLRLEAIRRYREVGLSLAEIAEVLAAPTDRTAAILERRLEALNGEIGALREQQRIVARLLRGRAALTPARAMDKRRWVAVLRAAGLSDEDMHRWHIEFERMAPAAHQDFLESLGIVPEEIARIRAASRDVRPRTKGSALDVPRGRS